jgi:hypothetical protein
VYAAGLLAALSQGLPLLIIGYSLLEGVGSALMIPPIYILVTVAFPDVKSRARYFGVVSGAGGLGAAAGPLIGGLVTSAISWRASFGLQVLVVTWIIWLARKITDSVRSGPVPLDLTGAVLSAAGLFFVVLGFLQSRTYGFGKSRQDFTIGGTVVIPKGSISPVWLFVAIGALFLLGFFLHARSRENKGRDVLLPLRLFRNKIANLGLGTQAIQWLILQGVLLHRLGVPAGSQPLQRHPDRPDPQPGHDRDSGRVGRRGQVRPAAPATVADHRRVPGHRGRDDLAASPGPSKRGHLAVDTGAAAVRRRGRDHADLLGQRRPIQLPRRRPGRDLRPIPQRLEPGILTRHGPSRLGPGGRQPPLRKAFRRRSHHHARDRAHRPDPRHPHPPPAHPGHGNTKSRHRTCNLTASAVTPRAPELGVRVLAVVILAVFAGLKSVAMLAVGLGGAAVSLAAAALGGHRVGGARLVARADDAEIRSPQALLVANNHMETTTLPA